MCQPPGLLWLHPAEAHCRPQQAPHHHTAFLQPPSSPAPAPARRRRDAWECAQQLASEESWRLLGAAALEALELQLATGAFRQAQDPGMELSLEALRGCEDRSLLAARVMVLLGRDSGAAQDLFLRSSQPLAALEMRVDLKQWQQALALAQQLDPGSIAGICKEHAAMLEMTGRWARLCAAAF